MFSRYLAHLAVKLNYQPEVILAGRRINEAASDFVADEIHKKIATQFPSTPAKILVLGLTFKEDVPDLRNTKIINLVRRLKNYGHRIDIHDPLANPQDAKNHYDVDLKSSLEDLNGYDVVVGAVAHEGYKSFNHDVFTKLLRVDGLIADIKRMWGPYVCAAQQIYWSL